MKEWAVCLLHSEIMEEKNSYEISHQDKINEEEYRTGNKSVPSFMSEWKT